ncbi:MAG: DUF2975 domain-containing protein [Defluviitaleaceae bacterium]|nr:DUF2975 domain-containing protein [Defluviitaleaceae bacterium]
MFEKESTSSERRSSGKVSSSKMDAHSARFSVEQNRFRHKLTKLLLELMFYGGIATVIAIPFTTLDMRAFLRLPQYISAPYMILVMFAGIFAVYIVFQLKRMYKTLLDGSPFIVQNVSCLRNCAVASALIALMFFVRLFMWFTYAALLVSIAFAMLSLFSLTIKDLFKQAIAYKEETDWTV